MRDQKRRRVQKSSNKQKTTNPDQISLGWMSSTRANWSFPGRKWLFFFFSAEYIDYHLTAAFRDISPLLRPIAAPFDFLRYLFNQLWLQMEMQNKSKKAWRSIRRGAVAFMTDALFDLFTVPLRISIRTEATSERRWEMNGAEANEKKRYSNMLLPQVANN